MRVRFSVSVGVCVCVCVRVGVRACVLACEVGTVYILFYALSNAKKLNHKMSPRSIVAPVP